MSTTSIVDQIVRGVITTPTDNFALSYLATLLGDKLVFGTGSNDSILAYLSAALSPVYLAVLFAIMAYIGVGGTAKTAMDGEFLGRNWHSVGVPSFLMVCILLLSPVPNQNGITLGQVIFVKSIVIGSNFGDFVLKTAVEQTQNLNNNMATNQAINSGDSEVHAQLRDMSERMQSYLKIYLCSMQYTVNGGANDSGYFVQLASLCAVPNDAVALYKPYFRAVDYTDSGTVAAIPAANVTVGTSDAAKEYQCVFNTFESFRTTKPDAATISASKGVIKNDFPIKIPTAANSNELTINSRAQVSFNSDAMLGLWPASVVNALQCVGTNQTAAQQATVSSHDAASSWGHGWAMAAALASDDIRARTSNGKAGVEIKNPQPTNLSSTGNDTLTQMQISKLLREVDDAKPSFDTQMTNIAIGSSSSSQGSFNITSYSDKTKMGIAAVMGGGVILSNAGATTIDVGGKVLKDGAGRVVSPRASAKAFTNGMFEAVSKVPGLSSATRMGDWATNRVGGTLRNLREFSRAAHTANVVKAESAEAMRQLGDVSIAGFKGLGAVTKLVQKVAPTVSKFAKVGAAMIYSIPGLGAGLTYTIIMLNVITLIPEIVMVVALIMWLLQVTAWFLMIPITTLIIAIPNTDAGHSSWRSALALALTPGVITLFYLVSLVMYDVITEVAFYSIFASQYSTSYTGGLGASAINLIEDLFTGELVFRLIAFVGLLAIGFTSTATMVLRGPDWFFRAVGLRHQIEGTLGTGELEGATQRLKSIAKL